MPPTHCPDLLGWELPRALDECRALGLSVSVVNAAPAKAAAAAVAGESEASETSYRVAAMRAQAEGGITLIVCAEVW